MKVQPAEMSCPDHGRGSGHGAEAGHKSDREKAGARSQELTWDRKRRPATPSMSIRGKLRRIPEVGQANSGLNFDGCVLRWSGTMNEMKMWNRFPARFARRPRSQSPMDPENVTPGKSLAIPQRPLRDGDFSAQAAISPEAQLISPRSITRAKGKLPVPGPIRMRSSAPRTNHTPRTISDSA